MGGLVTVPPCRHAGRQHLLAPTPQGFCRNMSALPTAQLLKRLNSKANTARRRQSSPPPPDDMLADATAGHFTPGFGRNRRAGSDGSRYELFNIKRSAGGPTIVPLRSLMDW